MAVLAIDPGAKTGGALLDSSGSALAFAISDPTIWQRYRIVRWAVAWAKERGESLEIVIEDQHLGRGGKANPATTIELVRRAERWIAIAELLAVPWSRVSPSTWHTELASVPAYDEQGEHRTPKQRAAILVPRLWPEVGLCRGEPGVDPFASVASTKLPQDPVEAIVMARWRLGFGRVREAAPRRKKAKPKRRAEP